ncbi:MAG: tRNA (N(6)-L-threonylcarbamoyladenosine(37)-C(2))-methylthiotransferase MtaB [Bacilli bacterium]|jgi:threonylcarbamoyladenosine tRNA methylthiotransferase MtaB|nr:tRNA (N(6)-L-threonylcarbamoyladenosine(37)-C(2))-methylthiotransferase MtaB [Bacilli bacterium]HHU23984.1 tRNA (N(6)-L-threonylcarbamoyladenosine(37)-C(2))-methylthiotransferase MtaB [Acholeplasmataceae bacterium]
MNIESEKNTTIKFKIHTLGCKVNLYESEAVSSQLGEAGWQWTDNDAEADVQIINTCTVTKTSDAKSRKLIRSLIRKNPAAIMVVMGCYSQIAPEEVIAIEGVDIVLGSSGKSKIIDYVKEFQKTKIKRHYQKSIEEYQTFEELKMGRLQKHTRGFIKIQDGCENFCSYCLIPYARGPIRSRDMTSVLEEIKNLVDSGVKEVILSGINTGTYGKDLGNITLAELVDSILSTFPQLARLRLSSIELLEITDELLALFRKYPERLAKLLHIPLQAGSDSVLKRMNRRYTTLEYENRIKEIRSLIPDIAITTDCLGGFVGETEAEHQEAIDFINRIGFAQMHIFPYSRRKGTKADTLNGHLAPEIIEERTRTLLKLSSALKQEYQERFIDSTQLVLFENRKQGLWRGYSSNYIEVFVEDEKDLTNLLLPVKLEQIINGQVIGKLIGGVDDGIY